MSQHDVYKQALTNAMKIMINYGKDPDYQSKTVMISLYDDSEKYDSASVAMGDPDTLGHLALNIVQQLPDEHLIHVVSHFVNDYPEVVRDLLEIHDEENE